MASIIGTAFQTMLLNLVQLALGCLLPYFATRLNKRGVHIAAQGCGAKLLAAATASLAGLLLPLGPFGILPAVAALWLLGLELPLALPAFVSAFIFNLSMPLTEPVFVWNGNIIRIAAAFAAGLLAGLLLSLRKADAPAVLRRGVWQQLFIGQEGEAGYFGLLRNYVEAAGLFLVAGAILKAAFSGSVSYWLQNQFFSSGAGLTTMTALSRLNVFHPAFGAGVQILGRLADFTALAAAAFLLKAKSFAALLVFYIAIALLLSIGLFF